MEKRWEGAGRDGGMQEERGWRKGEGERRGAKRPGPRWSYTKGEEVWHRDGDKRQLAREMETTRDSAGARQGTGQMWAGTGEQKGMKSRRGRDREMGKSRRKGPSWRKLGRGVAERREKEGKSQPEGRREMYRNADVKGKGREGRGRDTGEGKETGRWGREMGKNRETETGREPCGGE